VNFPVFGQSSRTSVRLATAQGYLDVVMFLYHIRVNLNLRDEIGQTALHIAVFKDYSSIVNLTILLMSSFSYVKEPRKRQKMTMVKLLKHMQRSRLLSGCLYVLTISSFRIRKMAILHSSKPLSRAVP
jgi:uncharacterized protein (DUF486 family)